MPKNMCKTRIMNTRTWCRVAGLWLLLAMWPAVLQARQAPLALDLETAMELARERNPGLRVAALEVTRADVAVDAVRGGYLPSLNAQATYNRNIKKPVIFLPPGSPFGDVLEIGSDNSYMAAMAARVPVYNPVLNAQLQAARAERELAGEQYRASRIDMTYFVRSAFYDALLARESMEVMQMSYEQAKDNLEQTRKLQQQGLVAEYDLIRAQVQTENLRPSVLQTETAFQMAQNYLKALIGLELSESVELVGNLAEAAENMLVEFHIAEANRSLQRNSDLVQMGMQIRLLGEQQRAVRASALPSLAMSGNYSFQTESNDFRFGDYNWIQMFSAGLQLTIPIFNGFQVRQQERQLEIAGRQMRLQKEFMEENLKIQLDNILQSMAVALEKSSNAENTVAMAARGHDIARARYESGQGTLLEVNDSELALTQARFNLLQAKHELLQARAEYDKFIGENN